MWTYSFWNIYIYIYIYIYIMRRSRGQPVDSHFNIYNTELYGTVLLPSLGCSTLLFIRILKYRMLFKVASSTIFCVFAMIWPTVESRSPGPSQFLLKSMEHCLLF